MCGGGGLFWPQLSYVISGLSWDHSWITSRWMRLCFVCHVAVGWSVYNACSWIESLLFGVTLTVLEHVPCSAHKPLPPSPLRITPAKALWLLSCSSLSALSSLAHFFPFSLFLCVVFVSEPEVSRDRHSSGATDPVFCFGPVPFSHVRVPPPPLSSPDL